MRFVAFAVIGLAIALVGYLQLRDTGGSSTPQPGRLNASAVTAVQLAALATSLGHPIFWMGPSSASTYEYSRGTDGATFVRYLTPGAKVGSSKPYLTIATYPFVGAYAALQKFARQSGTNSVKIANGGLAVVSTRYPSSVHVAYPSLDYQVEVYDPSPATALALITHGKLVALGKLTAAASPAGAQTVSGAVLRAFAATLDHPVYWAGPRPHTTYELTQTQSGQVYLRYLPPGVAAGATRPYLTIATYPFPGAFGAIQALAKQKGATTFSLAGGGLAVIDSRTPTSIHLAFPGSSYQVEVFDTNPRVVRSIITSGQVRAIG